MHFYNESGHSIIDGSILALESIINNIALTPQKWTIGDASETAPLVETLTMRSFHFQILLHPYVL